MTSKIKKLFVLVGPPAVGKSTWIKNTFEQEPYVVSRDNAVERVADELGWTYSDMFVTPPEDAGLGDTDEKYGTVVVAPKWMNWTKTAFSKVLSANAKVQSYFNNMVSMASSSGKDIVVDMKNMNSKSRKRAIRMVDDRYQKIAVVFEFEGVEDMLQKVAAGRDAAAKRMGKDKPIPSSVYDAMFKSFSRPIKAEGFDEIISIDNREMIKALANEHSSIEEEYIFSSSRWQQLSNIKHRPENKLIEKASAEAMQDLMAFFDNNVFSLKLKRNEKIKKSVSRSAAVEVVDGPYIYLSKVQPFTKRKK